MKFPRSVSPRLGKILFLLAVTTAPIAVSSHAEAAQAVFFNTISLGRADFESRVTGAGGTFTVDTLSGLTDDTSWDRGPYLIEATNGSSRSISPGSIFSSATATNGQGIEMSASNNPAITTTGLTFTCDSPINAFGIALQGWATTGWPSSLYISFDGGAPILVGTAGSRNDNPGYAASEGDTTFVAGIDDSATFTSLTFYGISTGNIDVLNAGGLIYYAIVPLGGLNGKPYVDNTANTSVSGYSQYFGDNDQDGGALQTIATYLNTASTSEVTQAMKEIFPVNTGVASQNMATASGQTASVLLSKVGTVLGNMPSSNGGSVQNFANAMGFSQSYSAPAEEFDADHVDIATDPLYALSQTPYQKFESGQNAFWIDGVVAGANGDKTDETLGYDTLSYGVVAGAERSITPDTLIGIIGSTFRSNIDMDGNTGETDVNNYNFGFYGQQLLGATKITGMATVGYGAYDGHRNINIGGISARPEADYDSWSYAASLGVSHLFEHGDVKIEPFAMASYNYIDTDGYTETNGGALNMTVGDDSTSIGSVKAGVTVQHANDIGGTPFEIRVKPYVGYQWELEESGPTVRLGNAAGTTTINGRDINSLELGIGVESKFEVSEDTNIKVGFDVSGDKNEERAVGFVGVGIKF